METLLSTGARRRTGTQHLLIAGSWIRYLLDNQSPDEVKRYVATQDCEETFGKTLEELKGKWLVWLHGSNTKILDTALMGFDDTVVFHKKIKGIKDRVRLRVAGDDRFYLFHNGAFMRSGHTWFHATPLFLELTGDDETEIVVVNQESAGGLLLEIVDSKGTVRVISDEHWTARRAKTKQVPAKVMGPPLSGPWKAFLSDARKPPIVSTRGSWIWIP